MFQKSRFVSLVSGDVVVGWVNARTGKGEIDDYFLAGDQLKCDDGAESCPDTSKPVKIIEVSMALNTSTDFYLRGKKNQGYIPILFRIIDLSLNTSASLITRVLLDCLII